MEISSGADVRAEPAANENDVLNVHRANQIFTLQKNIEFLKKNHQEMLMTLHNEVERLKKSNCGKTFLIFCICIRTSTHAYFGAKVSEACSRGYGCSNHDGKNSRPGGATSISSAEK